ncbi:tyrosine-type recombinase/integrase [Mycobacterium angelicum]|uniref:Integrase n=1 Tax=Mycobacterium angelicum TaxID=470074 RepID=A0A1W9Z7W5_MYCAN|nr:tyrosine-type recombinase/integrase [Mycobacterium angelicum]MCV7198023.1 tyrosine-type recombinase/integrase [Mycobacterium angelicum]ORA08630.1 integrase [Mycobacterium angelicum]
MPPVRAYAPVPEVDLLAAYDEHCARLGLISVNLGSAARTFLRRWPDPQRWAGEPLEARLTVSHPTRSFVTFLMLAGYLRPGYDYLIRRKLAVFWRHLPLGPLAEDLVRFLGAAQELGFTERTRSAAASQVIGRLLIQTGRRLDALTDNDFDDLLTASAARHGAGKPSSHYSSATHTARRVMFHLGVFTEQPVNATSLLRQSFAQRMRDATSALRGSFVAYLDRLTATHSRGTVTGTATRLNHFAAHLAAVDAALPSLADLDRRRHIETYLTATAEAMNSRTGAPIQASERRGRILAVHCLLNDIAEWGWPEAPQRRLVFRSDIPKLPRALPRYLTPDLDRRLTHMLQTWPERLPADALLLQRATGLRIGELVDLELDSVHEIPGQGAWLKVPLGKLNTERMVPLDEETVALIDRIVAHRSPGRPLPHPRTARPTDYLLTHHGRRLTVDHLRDVLTRVTTDAGLPHITPHQLRHTYATALVNAGVSLQSLMALLGHVSAEMSLRYGRLFDSTVRTEYERALASAKAHLGTLPTEPPQGRVSLPIVAGDWKDAPAVKARLAGGFCIRAQVQGPCAYANICEHCPNFRTDTGYLPVLAAQRADTETLARDAEARGWTGEAERHRRLIERLDAHISQTQTG